MCYRTGIRRAGSASVLTCAAVLTSCWKPTCAASSTNASPTCPIRCAANCASSRFPSRKSLSNRLVDWSLPCAMRLSGPRRLRRFVPSTQLLRCLAPATPSGSHIRIRNYSGARRKLSTNRSRSCVAASTRPVPWSPPSRGRATNASCCRCPGSRTPPTSSARSTRQPSSPSTS